MTTTEPIPVAEWLTEARRLFGDDPKKWKFQCPVCGNIQTPEDFKQVGADPQSVYQECIGRHMPKSDRASNFADTPAKNGNKSPCDYAAYGLFQFGRKVIPEGGGKPTPVFPFAPEEQPV
jgi:hypothetical protein